MEQYDDSYFDLYRKRRQFRLRRSEARLSRIEVIKKPGRLLDIGCSLGYFVEAALRRGWEAEGIEISPYAAREARNIGLDVSAGELQDAAFPGESFDCVTMWDVLEHVTDPVEHMLEVRRVLARDGVVVIGTPDLGHLMPRLKRDRWRHLKPGEHIFYFRRSSIGALLHQSGFRVVPSPSPLPVVGGVLTALWWRTQFNDVMTIYGVKNEL
jgi:2-polyprenyl-3-methyl-5-hydroxy-6-metoxy-1,4-benzoquinol methylase